MDQRTTSAARRGRRLADQLLARFGAELRLARRSAGLTQTQLGVAAGVSQPFVSMVELGTRQPDLPTACALSIAAGHDLSLRLFPSGTIRLRDSGQFADVQHIVTQAHHSWHSRIEAPVSRSTLDRRAADLVLIGEAEAIHVEVERAIFDFQAQLRACQLKREALTELLERPVRLVVAVPGTRRMREKTAVMQPALHVALPVSSATVWRSIRTGRPLGADGLLFLPPRPQITPELWR